MSGAVAVGAVAFLRGFLGPMILTPEANQGPFLGIFLTGPLGVFVGAVAGYVHWLVMRKRVAAPVVEASKSGEAAMKDATDPDGSAPIAGIPPETPDPLRVRPSPEATPLDGKAVPLRRAGDAGVGRQSTTHGRALDTWSTRERGRGRR